jgi:hypothetical protein
MNKVYIGKWFIPRMLNLQQEELAVRQYNFCSPNIEVWVINRPVKCNIIILSNVISMQRIFAYKRSVLEVSSAIVIR